MNTSLVGRKSSAKSSDAGTKPKWQRGQSKKQRHGVQPTTLTIVGLLLLVLPFFLNEFSLSLMAGYLPLVILAISVDLLWGEGRIISFGHAAFFAVGAYVAGLLLKGAAGTSDAMSLLSGGGQKSWFDQAIAVLSEPKFLGFPVLALILPPLLAGLLGFAIGTVIFRIGSAEIYIPLVTLGIGVILTTALSNIPEVGGSNGLAGVPSFTINGPLGFLGDYWFNLFFLGAVYLGYWLFRRSRSGRMWRGLGDEPLRLEAMGHNVLELRVAGFAASTALAGLAGALYVGTTGYIGPSQAGVTSSANALIWVAVGGPGNFFGPLVGVLVVNFGEQFLSVQMPETWPLILGAALIAVVLFLPKGVPGIGVQLGLLVQRLKRNRSTDTEVGVADERSEYDALDPQGDR